MRRRRRVLCDSHFEYSGPNGEAGTAKISLSSSWILTVRGGKSKGACMRESALPGLHQRNQLSRSVSPVCRHAVESGLSRLGTNRPLLYNLAGLHSLEQAGAGDDPESDAPPRAVRKLVVCIFFAHRPKIRRFQLHNHHRQSVFVLRAHGRRPSAVSTCLVPAKNQVGLVSASAPEVQRASAHASVSTLARSLDPLDEKIHDPFMFQRVFPA